MPRLLKEHRPRLVLLDLVLPEFDGMELMRHIFETAGVPVLVLSAYGQGEVIAQAFDAGPSCAGEPHPHEPSRPNPVFWGN